MSSFQEYNLYDNLLYKRKRSYSDDFFLNINLIDFNHIKKTHQTKYNNKQIIIPRCIHKYHICSPWCNYVKNNLKNTLEYYPPNIYIYPDHLYVYI